MSVGLVGASASAGSESRHLQLRRDCSYRRLQQLWSEELGESPVSRPGRVCTYRQYYCIAELSKEEEGDLGSMSCARGQRACVCGEHYDKNNSLFVFLVVYAFQLGYPDTWETGVGWRIEENSCRWCPETGNRCGTHHQSPIDLKREVALEGKAGNLANECIDVHWMSYFDSTCTYEELKRQNAFTVERHALKVTQPVEHMGNDKYRIGCRNELGRRWGKIDFSRVSVCRSRVRAQV